MKCQNTAFSSPEYSLAMPKVYFCAILGKKVSRPKNGPKVVVLVNASIWAKKNFPKYFTKWDAIFQDYHYDST